jgi:hypothetical protein
MVNVWLTTQAELYSRHVQIHRYNMLLSILNVFLLGGLIPTVWAQDLNIETIAPNPVKRGDGHWL